MDEKNGLQQFQMENCQPITKLEDKKKKKKNKKKKKTVIMLREFVAERQSSVYSSQVRSWLSRT